MMAFMMISMSARNCKLNTMTDYDSIWRTQDEIRTVVNAVLDFLHQSPQISQDEIEHAVLDAIDASEEVPYGILAQNAAF